MWVCYTLLIKISRTQKEKCCTLSLIFGTKSKKMRPDEHERRILKMKQQEVGGGKRGKRDVRRIWLENLVGRKEKVIMKPIHNIGNKVKKWERGLRKRNRGGE
jgi:hypothetical protein